MSELASRSQLRMSFVRWALFTVPLLMVLGWLSGQIAGSSDTNAWYQALRQPAAQPPGYVFGIVWPTLYFLQGLALAMVLNARSARLRWTAVGMFALQFLANMVWSPLFFGMHQVSSAFFLILLILLLAIGATLLFGRIRPLAAWLMVPYLAWLCFAAILNFQIDRLNPDAETLYAPAARTQI
ncbi:TspO/MBR family protein [Novosphingopyxis sp. YJ-S2-01]|uniref:TspO/MBR family protein n=1 Tax=Novosphingopyxis sp. YJ-S2-01 TaxID=2794021 RepID=UPI0018DC7E81|nr:TspO/MBR family protein [Novosphingopyxis sp. YJ-S2-01]MBH9536298.1 tryptophan-rich sensory protein [Novosphingopyxis sp. YJ-S2-01]